MIELKRIDNRVVQRAQEENRKQGIPNVYSIRGHVCHERPDGMLTLEDPYLESEVSPSTPDEEDSEP